MNWKNIVLTILAVILLFGFAVGMTSPAITDEAKAFHMNEGVEDEYAFLFE